MNNQPLKNILCLSLLLMLAACKSADVQQEPLPEQSDIAGAEEVLRSEPAYTANPDIRDSDRFYYALRLLEQGEAQHARVELETFLVHQPRSRRARELIRQIDTPVADYFPRDYFEVKLQPGESLSVLARDYLGDLYAFHILARYNLIDTPSRINAGQIIRIPRTTRAEQHRKNLSQRSSRTPPGSPDPKAAENEAEADAEQQQPAPDQLALMDAALADNDYATAIRHLDSLRTSQQLSAAQERRAADIYHQYADELRDSEPTRAARYYFEAAKLEIKINRPDSALPLLKQSLALNPNNPTANEIYGILKYELTSRYHRKATTAYDNQQWDLAVRLWTLVLEIDPKHQQAKAQLAEIRELKAKQDNPPGDP